MKLLKNKHLKSFLCTLVAFVMIFAAMPAMEAQAATDVTVHFKNTEGWATVNAYSWDSAGNNAFGGWPGTAIEADSANEGYYVCTITGYADDSLNIIFNDGATQTVDLKADLTQGTEWWVVPTDGSSGKFECAVNTSKADAEAGKNQEAGTADKPADTVTQTKPEVGADTQSPIIYGNEVTFFYQDASASEVVVAGSMNEWSTTAAVMEKDGDLFYYTMAVEAGSYQYKFVVDGNWIQDPANQTTADDGFGGLNSAFEVTGSAEAGDTDNNTNDDTNNEDASGKYVLTIYGYSANEAHNKVDAAAVYIWDKGGETAGTTLFEGQDFSFTETEEIDGRTWLKAKVELPATSEVGLILKSVGDWSWQTADLIFSNADKADATLYLVEGHEKAYTSIDEITFEAASTDADTEKEENKRPTSSNKKNEIDPTVLAWIIVAIVVVATAVIAVVVVKKLTANLPVVEKKEVTEEAVETETVEETETTETSDEE